MDTALEYRYEHASEEEIVAHFLVCDDTFLAALRERINLTDYAHKLHSRSRRFEAWSGNRLVGLLAAYHNDRAAMVYISNVSVLSDCWRHGIAGRLLMLCLAQARELGMQKAALEVAHGNHAAIELYRRYGFSSSSAPEGNILHMHLHFNHPERACIDEHS